MEFQYTIPKTTIGEILRAVRQRKKLKAYELANLVGVNPVYITQIEKGYKLPSPETFLKILDILKVDVITFATLKEKFLEKKFPALDKTRCLFTLYYKKNHPNPKKEMKSVNEEWLKKIGILKRKKP